MTEQLLRLEYSESDYFEDGKTQIVRNEFEVDFEVIDEKDRLEIVTSAFHYTTKKVVSPQNLFIDTNM